MWWHLDISVSLPCLDWWWQGLCQRIPLPPLHQISIDFIITVHSPIIAWKGPYFRQLYLYSFPFSAHHQPTSPPIHASCRRGDLTARIWIWWTSGQSPPAAELAALCITENIWLSVPHSCCPYHPPSLKGPFMGQHNSTKGFQRCNPSRLTPIPCRHQPTGTDYLIQLTSRKLSLRALNPGETQPTRLHTQAGPGPIHKTSVYPIGLLLDVWIFKSF